jgi:predicted permease
MSGFLYDLRFASRTLKRAPGFTAVGIVTLSLGIGANSAIFSVIDGVLLEPLPYDDPEELVWVAESSSDGGTMAVAWANFRDWRSESRSFEALALYGLGGTTVLGGSEPSWVTTAVVSQDFWGAFPLRPVAGRLPGPDDHRPGAPPVAVVSGLFARELFGTADVVGRTVESGGARTEIVGVLPAAFDFPAGARIWSPQELTPQGESRSAHNWSVVGRLRDGVDAAQARAELGPLTRRLVATAVDDDPEYLATGAVVVPLHDQLVGSARRPLELLFGAAGFVLLVACVNLASSVLARGTSRSRELAVRSALGAGRGRLAAQLFLEGSVLAASGGAAGLGVAALILVILRRLGGDSIPHLEAVQLDASVLGFTLVASFATALLFGLVPAWRAANGAEAATLRSGGRGEDGYRGRAWSVLVTTEVGLALVLLLGSGLLIRSFGAVLSEEAGFHADDVALTPMALSALEYPDLEAHRSFWDDMLVRAAAIPGASGVGLVSSRPVSGFAPNGRVSLDGDPSKNGDGVYVVASAGAFGALDIPLRRGRLFDDRDGPTDPHAVIVSQSFADAHWPGEDPLGRQVSGGGMDDYWDADPVVFGTVVGVVGDVRYRDLTRAGEPTVYWSYRQRPFRIRFNAWLVAESAAGDPSLVAWGLREAVREADPDVAVRMSYLSDLVADSVGERRFVLLILVAFAALALTLSAVGIYGVVSYAAARRTREMAIRLALGAAPVSVRGLVLREGLRPVVIGLMLGVGGGLALSRVMHGLLYEVRPADPPTFAAAVLGLFLTACLASWIPAVRGTRVDPMITMRSE